MSTDIILGENEFNYSLPQKIISFAAPSVGARQSAIIDITEALLTEGKPAGAGWTLSAFPKMDPSGRDFGNGGGLKLRYWEVDAAGNASPIISENSLVPQGANTPYPSFLLGESDIGKRYQYEVETRTNMGLVEVYLAWTRLVGE